MRVFVGCDFNLTPGETFSWKTGEPRIPIQLTLDRMGDHMNKTLKMGTTKVIEWHSGPRRFDVSGGDAETRPVNVALYWVIKATSKEGADGVPIGAVIPFAGDDKKIPAPAYFPWWIRCDCAKVESDQLGHILPVVKDKFKLASSPSSSKVFWPPDLRGKFIRGVDWESVHDPDGKSRQPAPNGDTAGLGTWQGCSTAFKDRKPCVDVEHFSKWYHKTSNAAGNHNFRDDKYTDHQVWSGGDKETRPKNAAMHFYINTLPHDSQPDFPVGGVIARIGELKDERWLPCDGDPRPIRTESGEDPLYKAIGKIWNWSTEIEDLFSVPNLFGRFIRGADLVGAPNGDPDRDNRTEYYGWEKRVGAGSFQDWATAMPVSKPLSISISYPTDEYQNAKTSGGATDESTRASGAKSFPLKFETPDNETAPTCMAVRFYVCATGYDGTG